MTTTKRIFLPLLCLLLLVIGCKKPDDTPCPSTVHDVPIASFLRSYLFGDSSQWVYERASDSLLDTVMLTSIVRTVYEYESAGGTANMTGGCPSQFAEERFSLSYFSTLTGSSGAGIHYDEIWPSGNPSGLALWGGQVGQSRSGVVIEAIHDSLHVGSNTFAHVTQVFTNVGCLEEPGVYRFYYCPNIGIVRKEIMWGDSVHNTYDLVEWQVHPYP